MLNISTIGMRVESSGIWRLSITFLNVSVDIFAHLATRRTLVRSGKWESLANNHVPNRLWKAMSPLSSLCAQGHRHAGQIWTRPHSSSEKKSWCYGIQTHFRKQSGEDLHMGVMVRCLHIFGLFTILMMICQEELVIIGKNEAQCFKKLITSYCKCLKAVCANKRGENLPFVINPHMCCCPVKSVFRKPQ